jgi:murein L,D-transpeptidase YcbB/YkuD
MGGTALDQYFPSDFSYAPEEVAGVWAEGANDPQGWNALMNTYAVLGRGNLQEGLRKGSSAVRGGSTQYDRALNQADKMGEFEKRRMRELVGAMDTFVPDTSWQYTNHESPDLYVEQAKKAGMAPRAYMEMILKQKWKDVDLSSGQQYGRQVYYKKKSPKNEGRGDVANIQDALNRAGASIAVDGKMGPQTVRALRAFQQRVGLKPDAIVGPKTRAALKIR